MKKITMGAFLLELFHALKARHTKNIAKGPASAAYWADKVKW